MSKNTKKREQKQRKVGLRNVEEIPPAKLSELLSEFVFTVRSKDGNDYEGTSRPWKRLRVWSSSSGPTLKENYFIQTMLYELSSLNFF